MKKLIATLLFVTACGASGPSRELIDARAAYERAASSNAAGYVPAELHDAKTALDKAEKESADEAFSAETKDLSYIAMRKAQRAEALGNAAAAVAAAGAFDQERTKTAEAVIDAQKGKLKANEQALAQNQQDLAKSKEQIAAEQKARADAEAKAADAEKKSKEAMDALARQMAVKDDTRGTVITLSGSVLFVTGKATLLPGATAQLDKVADALMKLPERHFTIEGHTDSTGSAAINAELSAKRANAVRDYLITKGVSADAISANGVGSGRPVADNKTDSGRAMNRRVEIIVDRSTSANAAAQN